MAEYKFNGIQRVKSGDEIIFEKEQTMKPIRIDGFSEKCPKCGEKVKYVVGAGTMFYGASESYEDWRVVEYNFCPNCGEKMERGADDDKA